MTDDAVLMRAVATGGRAERDAAFRTLVERHRDRVHRLALRYFRDATDAEDVTQEVFLTVLRRASTFRGDALLTTWLHRVTINTCHDVARRRGRRPSTAVADVVAVVDAVAPLPDATDRLPLSDALARALDTLEPDDRELLVRATVGGEPYADLADELGIAVGTVKSRVFRLRARLAEVLGPLLDEDAEGPGPTPGVDTDPPVLRPVDGRGPRGPPAG